MERFANLKYIFQLGCSIAVVVFLVGCGTVNVPNYIKDTHPHTHLIYGNFDQALSAVTQSLNKHGWAVVEQKDPTVYEHSPVQDEGGREILLFSDIKQVSSVMGTKYQRINIYLRSTSRPKETEMELRFISIGSYAGAKTKKYKHPDKAQMIFASVDQFLQ